MIFSVSLTMKDVCISPIPGSRLAGRFAGQLNGGGGKRTDLSVVDILLPHN